MFYVKMQDGEKVIKEELTDENVFTVCPKCGKELQIDLAEVFPDGVDLFTTSIICRECSKMMKDIKSKSFKIARDALEMVEEKEDLDVIEAMLSQDIEILVEEYWNEILHRESTIE